MQLSVGGIGNFKRKPEVKKSLDKHKCFNPNKVLFTSTVYIDYSYGKRTFSNYLAVSFYTNVH